MKIIKHLLEKNIDVQIKDKEGKNGYDFLDNESKKVIQNYITKSNLYVDGPFN